MLNRPTTDCAIINGVAQDITTWSILMRQPRRERSDMARQGRKARPSNKNQKKQRASTSDYFMQPGKRGTVIVLRKPIGNRATAKICGVMPSRVHAKMLVGQLERAESVVKDLFLEATDDGIEALEAVLLACCKEVLERGPKARGRRPDDAGEPEGEEEPASSE
jgi:hypothetical protein